MERPSHSIKALRFHTGSHRLSGAGLSFLIQGLFASVLIGGFVIERVAPPPPLDFTNVQKEVEQRTPPPPDPKFDKVDVPDAVPPVVNLETASPAGNPITTVAPKTGETVASVPPPQPKPNPVPDRAAASIAATHTSPPYPTIARRLGLEGRVMLRLTILADGKVSKAEVVTSSGRRDFDEAAQSWIVQHWTYQPAIKDGVPAASQALAAVNFTLTNP
jgi:protein TonB